MTIAQLAIDAMQRSMPELSESSHGREITGVIEEMIDCEDYETLLRYIYALFALAESEFGRKGFRL